MVKLLAIGIGGFLGAIARYGLSGLVHRWVGGPFPIGTFAVNIAGCFLIGTLVGFAEQRPGTSPEVQALLGIGFLGSFTTFATFGYETLELVRLGHHRWALLTIVGSVLVGVAAVAVGHYLAARCFAVGLR